MGRGQEGCRATVGEQGCSWWLRSAPLAGGAAEEAGTQSCEELAQRRGLVVASLAWRVASSTWAEVAGDPDLVSSELLERGAQGQV